jgi:hypothetical protein
MAEAVEITKEMRCVGVEGKLNGNLGYLVLFQVLRRETCSSDETRNSSTILTTDMYVADSLCLGSHMYTMGFQNWRLNL